LKPRVARAGLSNVHPVCIVGENDTRVKRLAGKIDRVLVDAPCSGLGTLRRKPDARWRLEPGDPARFAEVQRELGTRFARLLRPGGRLVYATCAIGRTENEEVAAFLAARGPGLVPVPLERTLGAERARALGAEGHLLRLAPHRHGTDGFFVAAFERRKD